MPLSEGPASKNPARSFAGPSLRKKEPRALSRRPWPVNFFLRSAGSLRGQAAHCLPCAVGELRPSLAGVSFCSSAGPDWRQGAEPI